MDIPLPGEVIPYPSSSPSRISKSPPPIPPPPPDFDHIPLPPSLGKQHQSPPTVNHLPKVPPLPPVAPPLPTTAGKNFSSLPPLPASQKGSPTVEPKGNGEAILWSSIPPPPAPAPPPEDSRYSPSHATPADEENERVLLPPSFTMLPPPPPPSDHTHLPASLRSPTNLPANPPLPPSRPLLHPSQPDPPSLPTPPPKTAVLGKMQAKKRLLAFSMTKQGGGLGLSFGFAKSTRVVNKASANAFVGSGEDEEISEKKEVMNKTRKKKKEEREVLAIEEIKREEERLKEALGIRQQAQRAEQWAEEMWGISPPVHEMMLPSLGAPAAPTGEDRDIVTAGEGSAVAVVDASVPTGNLEGGGAATDSHHNSELEPNIVGDTVNTESSNNAEHGEGAKGKGDGVEGKEERKEGSERRDKKGERSSRKKDKEGGERSRRREEEGGDKERSKRERGSGGRSGRERRSERKRESRRANDGPLSGWKQIKEAGGEWNRERTSHRPGNREDRGRERRSSRSHRSRSRDQKRSAHSAHRSRSRSTDVHRRPQASPFFVAKGAKHGEKEFPLRLLRHTRTRPPLSFCENPETAAPPRPTTRREAFASEPPDVVRIMRLVAEAGLEKETEGKEQAGEASGLAALRVSYEGGDEDEGEDEQKRSDRPWFPDVSAFLSESVALARVPHENAVSEEDGLSTRDQEEESKNDYNTVPEDTTTVKKENANEEQENMNAEEEEEEEEEENKDKRLLLNEPESTVHSRWDSDPDSRGVAVPDTGEKSTPLSDTVETQLEASIEDEAKRVDDQNEFDEFPEVEGESETDENEESENTAEDSEGEEKKDQQLASEYEEFMKAVSVGGEEDEDEDDDDGGADGGGDWGSGGDEEEVESCEASDHQESDSSEHNSVVQNDAVGANSSDVELGSDVPSSEEAAATGRKIIKQSSSDSENNVGAAAKEKLGSESSKAAFTKEKAAKKKDKGKKDDFDSGGESEGEMQVPRKKRKLSSKKLMGVGEVAKRRGSEERKRKLKVKEKSQKRKREKDKRRKKKKERRKKKGRRRDDSSEVDSDSEEVSDDAKVTGSAKAGRAKLSESGNRKRSHKSEQSSEEMTSDNSSESSEGEDRRRLRKKKRKKRKKHVKMDGRREKEEGASEEDDQGKKNKVHSGKKRRGREGKSKRAGSDNSDCSEERDEQFSLGDEKSKVNAVGDDSLTGKENGLEDGSGKRGKKQKLKERERKKKRKGSPLNAKKHGSSRRRSPSTSDGSPTPGRGSHIRENVVSKVQGSRGGTNESGQSSVDSNSSGGSKKPVDNTTEENRPIESLHYWENSRVEVSRYHEESRTTICEKTRELGDSLSTSSSATLLIGKNSGTSIHKDKEIGCSALTVKKNIQDAVAKRIIAECALNMSSSSSPSSLSLSSISSSSSMDSSCSVSSQSDSISASSSTSSSSSASSSASSLSSSSSSSSESSSSVSSFQCSPLSSKADSAFSEEPESRILLKDRISVENLKDSSKSSILSGSPESYLADLSHSPLSKEGFILQNEHLDNVSHTKLEPDSLHNRANSKPSVKEVKENASLKVKSESSSGDSSLSRIDASSDVGHNPVRQYCEMSKSTERVEPMDIFPCRQVIANEKFSFGLTSQSEQSEEHSMSKSACKPQIGFRESKLNTSDYEPSAFKISSEDQSDGRSVTATGQRMTLLPSRPSRWDTRPGISGTHAMGSGVVRGVTQEWETPLAVPGLPILPVPFPTCQNKPLDEIPLPPQGVPRPVASPWGLEATTKKSALPVLSSSDLSINPIRGLADSTISDSDLVGRCIGGGFGGQLQVGLTSSPPAFSVALERPLVADNRTISSEGDQMVELFPRESDHFVQTREGMTLYKESGQQLHSADDKLMDHVVGAFSVDEHCLAKKANSSSPNFATLNKDLEHAVDPDSDPTPTDWDDPEAFVGSGHSGIKSHVIQVGNFLQVVPSEQPIISRAFVNPTPPVPAAVPLAVVSSGVPPAPVPPAISGVLPVAAPISSAVTFPSPVAPVTSSFQAISSSSPSNLSSVATLPCAIAPPLSVAPPVSPSLVSSVSTTSPIASNIPTSIPSVASLIPALSTAVPSLPSPNPSLSQIPLLASLAPTSSCPGISQLPLDPAAFLGTLISHALALEKQQQSLLHSPSCSPLVVGQGDDTPKELPMSVEKEARKGEKRKKMPKGNPAPQSTEKFPIEDAMSNADPLTKAIEDDFDIDPEEVALIQEAMSKVPGEEEDFGEQNNKISRLKEKRKKARVGNTVFPPATRGILIPPGIREKPSLLSGGISRGLNSGTQGQRKSVMFADGVRPGDGTSPSAGEDLPSPPPPVRKIPKEKRLRKKKKIKVKIIRQIRVESAEEDDDEDDDASPPPPPPGSPPPSLLLHHLSQHSPMGCEGAIPNPASHYPYPSAPTMPPTHAFSRLQAQQQLPPTPNAAHVATGGSAVLPPNALPPRIPQWAPCT